MQKQKPPAVEVKRRGRPRAYNPETALAETTKAFWKAGYSGTSLDDLSAAAGMNRPSLYLAFGDKRTLYLKALDRYWQLGYAAMQEALADDGPLQEALMRVYQKALTIYFPKNGEARGCFAIGTATTEAVEDPYIRAALAEGLHKLDAYFEVRFRSAQESGELGQDTDPGILAMMASAVLHSIAIRARAGAPQAELEHFAQEAVTALCRA